MFCWVASRRRWWWSDGPCFFYGFSSFRFPCGYACRIFSWFCFRTRGNDHHWQQPATHTNHHHFDQQHQIRKRVCIIFQLCNILPVFTHAVISSSAFKYFVKQTKNNESLLDCVRLLNGYRHHVISQASLIIYIN